MQERSISEREKQARIHQLSCTTGELFHDLYKGGEHPRAAQQMLEMYIKLRRMLPASVDGSGNHIGYTEAWPKTQGLT